MRPPIPNDKYGMLTGLRNRNLKVKELWALMESQPDALAHALKNGFKKANATKATLKAALLSASFSFTTTKPRSEFVPGYGVHQRSTHHSRAHATLAEASSLDPVSTGLIEACVD